MDNIGKWCDTSRGLELKGANVFVRIDDDMVSVDDVDGRSIGVVSVDNRWATNALTAEVATKRLLTVATTESPDEVLRTVRELTTDEPSPFTAAEIAAMVEVDLATMGR